MYLGSINHINPDEWYAQGRLSNIVTTDGRKLDEALRNHPDGPGHRKGDRVGKYYNGADVIAFYEVLEMAARRNQRILELRRDALVEIEKVANSLRQAGRCDVHFMHKSLETASRCIEAIHSHQF